MEAVDARAMALINLKRRFLKKGTIDLRDSRSLERDEFERIQVATSVLLLEVAKSDDKFSSIEKTTIKAILKRKFQISAEAIEELMEIAKRRRKESIDLWEFTHLINKNYSIEEKIKIVEAVWKVIYADDKLDKYEDHLVHKLARLLRLRHSDLIKAKLRVLDEIKP